MNSEAPNTEAPVRTMLADLAGGRPPVDIDLDRQIARGRRRLRHRRIGAVAGTLTAVTALAAGAVALLPGDGRSIPAAGQRDGRSAPQPREECYPQRPGVYSPLSTPLSRELDRQLEVAVPGKEDWNPAFARIAASEYFDSRCRPVHIVSAGVVRTHRVGALSVSLTVTVTVTKRFDWPSAEREYAETVCRDPRHATPGVCLIQRRLPDGSHAYVARLQKGRTLVAQIVRPDGSRVSLSVVDFDTGHPLSAETLLNIGRQITVRS